MADEKFWTTAELAREAGVSSAYIRQLLLDGKLDGERRGRNWIINDAIVQEWLKKREGTK